MNLTSKSEKEEKPKSDIAENLKSLFGFIKI
jgi:hypothetical protein